MCVKSAEKSRMVSYFFCSACASSAGLASATRVKASSSEQPRSMGLTIADVTRLRREDVRSVHRAQGQSGIVERDEADAALHDERVVTIGDDVPESHPTDRIEVQPRLHPDGDADTLDLDAARERMIGRDDGGSSADDAGGRHVRLVGEHRLAAELMEGPNGVCRVERQVA